MSLAAIALTIEVGRADVRWKEIADGWLVEIAVDRAPPDAAPRIERAMSGDIAVRTTREGAGLRIEIVPRERRALSVVRRGRRLTVGAVRATPRSEAPRILRAVRDPLDPAPEVAGAIAAGEAAFAEGRIDAAGESFAGLRRRYATRGVAELRLADVMALRGRWIDARREYETVARRFGRRIEGAIARTRLAAIETYLFAGDPPRDIRALAEAARGRPLAGAFALGAARVLLAVGSLGDAADLLATAKPAAALAAPHAALLAEAVAAAVRVPLVRGDPFAAAAARRRYDAVVAAHPDREAIDRAAHDALVALDLVPGAAQHPVAPAAPPAPAAAPAPPSAPRARLLAIAREISALEALAP